MQEEKQKVDRKRIVGLLTISCVATLCFAGLYVKALQKERQLEEAGMLSDASELDELWTDYIAAVNRAGQAEQIENNRKLVNDLILSFLDAYFILPSSREALLTGCENYVSEDAWRSVELLSENQDYGEKDRELFYYQGDCTELEDNDSQYDAFAVFTIREIENGSASNQSYMLVTTVEVGGNTAQITNIQTMTKIYFHAD